MIQVDRPELAVAGTVRPAADHRDLVIETLADREAALLEHVAELEAAVATYKMLFVAMLAHGHEQYQQLAVLDRRQYIYRTRSRWEHEEDEIPL